MPKPIQKKRKQPLNNPPTEKQNPIASDEETEAILARIEAERDYYHTCINGKY
jgi:hypothetical protein